MTNKLLREVNAVTNLGSIFVSDCDAAKHIKTTYRKGVEVVANLIEVIFEFLSTG